MKKIELFYFFNFDYNQSKKIKIKKGIELGLQPHLIDRYSNEMKNNQFDFIICSQHAIDKNDLYYDEYFKDKTQIEVAKMLGISQVQVSRIEKKVLGEMRKQLEEG